MKSYRLPRVAACLFLVSALSTAAATAGDLAPGVNLFFIKRSLNANEVHYDAVVDMERCVWKPPYVDSYWRDLEKGADVYSEIKFWEHGAYGFKITASSDTVIEIRLEALESDNIDRPIIARLSKAATGCSISMAIAIGGTEAEFQSAFIKVSDSFFPSYVYFDILGYRKGKKGSTIEADRVFERFEKDKSRNSTEKAIAERWKSGVVESGRKMGRPL